VRLWDARKAIIEDAAKNRQVEEIFGKSLTGRSRPQFFLEFVHQLGLGPFAERVSRPLTGLRGALYYGCLLSRQEWITGFDVAPHRPFLETFLRTMGAEVVDWSLENHCCGAGLAVTKPALADRMVDRIHDQAKRVRADCLVVFCPLCHMNLELRGNQMEHLPVFYITELVCLAIQTPHAREWPGRHLIDAGPLLSRLGIAR
jgi:heterodisulfide reductase subunit B